MDESEFDDFYASCYGRLTGQLYAMVGSREEAEECVQEAFVRAWAHRGQLDRAAQPEAWVRTTAYRLAVSRWRRMIRARRTTDRAVGPAASSNPVNENRVALVAALRTLPAAQREVLVLHHIADLSVPQVANELGVPEGTVKARLSRGRAALAAALSPELADDLDVPGNLGQPDYRPGAQHA